MTKRSLTPSLTCIRGWLSACCEFQEVIGALRWRQRHSCITNLSTRGFDGSGDSKWNVKLLTQRSLAPSWPTLTVTKKHYPYAVVQQLPQNVLLVSVQFPGQVSVLDTQDHVVPQGAELQIRPHHHWAFTNGLFRWKQPKVSGQLATHLSFVRAGGYLHLLKSPHISMFVFK